MSKRSASSKIVRNTLWYGLETVMDAAILFFSSLAVARYLGPEKLGYFSFVNFFVVVVNRTSGTGLATATRKYMTEFLGQDDLGATRAVYYFAYRYQLLGAVAITAVGLIAVVFFGDPRYKLMSSLLILSIVPGVMSWVPAQANNALEQLSKNTASAFGYLGTYLLVIVLTISFKWGLVGIASAALLGRTAEMVMRTIPLHRQLNTFPQGEMPPGLTSRIRRFCLQAVGIQLLTSLVWDRSEMLFLRAFGNLSQIAFYSIGYSLTANLLVVPNAFGGAAGVTLMAEAARDTSRIRSIVDNACRFLLFIVLPFHFGAAAIAKQAVLVAYGNAYRGVIPLLVPAVLLAIPRAFRELPETLIRAADRQADMLKWMIVTGIVNLALDALLIWKFGALGATWANGLAQAFGIVALWMSTRTYYDFSFPVQSALRLGGASLVMGAIARLLCDVLPGLPGLICAVVTALPIYLILVKLFRGLQPSDRVRLAALCERFPAQLRQASLSMIDFTVANPGIDRVVE